MKTEEQRGFMKTEEQKRADINTLEEQLQKTFPDYTWEDRAMWVQSPKDFLFGKTPLMICALEDIKPLITWLKEREP